MAIQSKTPASMTNAELLRALQDANICYVMNGIPDRKIKEVIASHVAEAIARIQHVHVAQAREPDVLSNLVYLCIIALKTVPSTKDIMK